MKEFIMLLILNSSGLYAGTGMGGGTPPSRQQLESQLMSMEHASAALFDNGASDVALLSNTELPPQLTLSTSKFSATDIQISEEDLARLRDRMTPLESVDRSGANKSFTVSAGDQLNTLKLIDRREAARAGVSP